jgi:hypothetical protein
MRWGGSPPTPLPMRRLVRAEPGQADGSKLKKERARELPDREGTYDELREEATRRRDKEVRRGEAAAEVKEANEGVTDE